MAARSGAQGKMLLALEPSGNETAVYVDFCVTEWSHTITRKTASSTTTCNYDEDDEVVYEDEDLISIGCEFSATGFTDGNASIDAILAANYTGPIRLKRFSGRYLTASKSIIKTIEFAGSVDNLQTFKITGKVKGKFKPNDTTVTP